MTVVLTKFRGDLSSHPFKSRRIASSTNATLDQTYASRTRRKSPLNRLKPGSSVGMAKAQRPNATNGQASRGRYLISAKRLPRRPGANRREYLFSVLRLILPEDIWPVTFSGLSES
jgi:hypothetical protein